MAELVFLNFNLELLPTPDSLISTSQTILSSNEPNAIAYSSVYENLDQDWTVVPFNKTPSRRKTLIAIAPFKQAKLDKDHASPSNARDHPGYQRIYTSQSQMALNPPQSSLEWGFQGHALTFSIVVNNQEFVVMFQSPLDLAQLTMEGVQLGMESYNQYGWMMAQETSSVELCCSASNGNLPQHQLSSRVSLLPHLQSGDLSCAMDTSTCDYGSNQSSIAYAYPSSPHSTRRYVSSGRHAFRSCHAWTRNSKPHSAKPYSTNSSRAQRGARTRASGFECKNMINEDQTLVKAFIIDDGSRWCICLKVFVGCMWTEAPTDVFELPNVAVNRHISV
ncbi:hypothetical protein RND71_013194 [Anisodus tanguticus]|uniref:Uncharacterized protein n=1 Tax=Anisodus tanguticus TaxID=243964 RepID=A0AAE1SGT7_9SOLA|nr:hypothetical protein RND71_013194 [Anisodus tanguticus]